MLKAKTEEQKKKERIHGEIHTEYVLNPFSGKREPWYFIDGVHVDSETLKIEKTK
jgi:hypothetical protein